MWFREELAVNWWFTDDKLSVNWWFTDSKLSVNWWFTDGKLSVNSRSISLLNGVTTLIDIYQRAIGEFREINHTYQPYKMKRKLHVGYYVYIPWTLSSTR